MEALPNLLCHVYNKTFLHTVENMQVKNLKIPIILLCNIWYTDHSSDQTEEFCVTKAISTEVCGMNSITTLLTGHSL